MRINRIYCRQPLSSGMRVVLSEERSHYVKNVLRLKKDHVIHVFNENDGEYQAVIVNIDKKSVEFDVGVSVNQIVESRLKINVGQGLSKGDRMDFVIQKSAELGAYAVSPIITEYCEVKLNDQRLAKKMQHWLNIAISACEQCGRVQIPIINEPMTLEEWCAQSFLGVKLVCDPESKGSLPADKEVSEVRLLIGPEGGLSPGEVEMAKQHGYLGWSLGPRILRTETAPVVAMSLLQSHWGDI